MVWGQEDYLAESERQLKDNETYESSSFEDADLVKLLEKSNSIFQSIRKKNLLLEMNLSILLMTIKRKPIMEQFTYCLRSISV